MNAHDKPSAVSASEIEAFFEGVFGKTSWMPAIEEIVEDHVRVRLQTSAKQLRPGGYISGPTQMTLADHVAYLAVFTRAGITPMALTSNLNIHFLRPAKGAWLEADAHVVKYGRTGVVIDVRLYTESGGKPVSQATVTYVLPREG